jgi:hypothetical protein
MGIGYKYLSLSIGTVEIGFLSFRNENLMGSLCGGEVWSEAEIRLSMGSCRDL